MKTSNKKTFKANLSTIARSGETLKESVQNAVIQAIDFYKDNGKGGNGDTGYLTQLMGVAQTTRAIRTKTLLGFIKAHANVKYTKIKNKEGKTLQVFRKASGKKGEVITQEITTQWYDWSADGIAQPDEVDFMKSIKALYTRMTNNDKKLKRGTEKDTAKAMAALSAILEA